MLLIALTGSIGMGKSTALDMFRQEGLAVYDADAGVHELYQKGEAGAQAVAKLFPDAMRDGAVDRQALGDIVLRDKAAMAQLEAVIHPLAVQKREAFLLAQAEAGAFAVVLDIPLLFEAGNAKHFDAVVCVSAPAEVQRQRVLARQGMTEEKFAAIVARQMPDAEKCEKADFVVDSSVPKPQMVQQIKEIIAQIRHKEDSEKET